MSPTLLSFAAFGFVALSVWGAAMLAARLPRRYGARVRDRAETLRVRRSADAPESLLRNPEAAAGLGAWKAGIKEYYDRSQSRIPFDTYVASASAVSVLSALAAAGVFRSVTAALAGLAVPLSLAAVPVVVRRGRRLQTLTRQLPSALDVISRAVRSGQTVPAAFQIVADQMDDPIAKEFGNCHAEQNLGIPYAASLRNLAYRAEVMELRILVVGLLVQSRSGGNISELLDQLSDTVRKRLRLRDRVRALTGEGRMQAGVLIALPTVAFLALLLIARDYALTLWSYPWLLAGSVGAQLLGALWIRRCIRFEY
jgi:tight adherence protein B